MEKQTILIANTHKEQAGWLKDDLIKKNIDIEVLDVETNISEDILYITLRIPTGGEAG